MDASQVPAGAMWRNRALDYFYRRDAGGVLCLWQKETAVWVPAAQRTDAEIAATPSFERVADPRVVIEIKCDVKPRPGFADAFAGVFAGIFGAVLGKQLAAAADPVRDSDLAGILAAEQAQAAHDFFSPPQGHRTLPNAGLAVVANPDERRVWGA